MLQCRPSKAIKCNNIRNVLRIITKKYFFKNICPQLNFMLKPLLIRDAKLIQQNNDFSSLLFKSGLFNQAPVCSPLMCLRSLEK